MILRVNGRHFLIPRRVLSFGTMNLYFPFSLKSNVVSWWLLIQEMEPQLTSRTVRLRMRRLIP